MSLELFIAYANTKDIATRNTLVKMNLNLARKVAHSVKKLCPEPYEDLEQEAAIGLVRSVEHFNPQRGVAFSSFAVPYIHGKLLQYLRDKGHLIRLTQAIQTLNNKGKKAAAVLSQRLGRTPTLAEVAEYLECPVEEYQAAVLALRVSSNCEPINLESEEILKIEDKSYYVYHAEEIEIDWDSLTQGELGMLENKSGSRRRLWHSLAKMNDTSTQPTKNSKDKASSC